MTPWSWRPLLPATAPHRSGRRRWHEAAARPYYGKELELRLSRSYGPGRYDHNYEERGLDYPIGYVRWTERRNLAAFVALLGKGQISVEDLITARIPVEAPPTHTRSYSTGPAHHSA